MNGSEVGNQNILFLETNPSKMLPECSKMAFLTFFVVAALFVNLAMLFQSRMPAAVQELSFAGVNKTSGRITGKPYIDVAFFAKYSYKKMKLARGMGRTFQSILENTQEPINLHVLLDSFSRQRTHRILKKTARYFHRRLNITLYDVDDITQQNQKTIDFIKRLFFNKDVGRYNDPIFFLSEIFHEIFPKRLHRVVFLDVDVIFKEDIRKLYDQFDSFAADNVIGIGPDLQPQYRSDFAKYRARHSNTTVGSPRPGLQGFNTGVVLFDLDRMRQSLLYNSLLNATLLEGLCHKYQFRGFLGHQDFFTLTGMEHPELYYQLSCAWNRQLDTGWRQEFGDQIFDQYHKCDQKINVFHANGDAIFSSL